VRRRCIATTNAGTPCRAAPGIDSTFCFNHDPEQAEAAAAARKLGGQRRKREGTLTAAFALESLDTVEGLQRLLDVITTDALAMDNGAPRLRILLAVVDRATKLIEVGELADRVERIEAAQRSRANRVVLTDLAGSLLDDER
jgi:hypothetical protein